jgi:hypothetical protein
MVMGSIPDEILDFSVDVIIAMESIQPQTEINTRNSITNSRSLPGGKEKMVHKANNITTICEPVL